ncbi:MAG: RNA polymerase sigma factor [Bacteroidota bacterium]
MKAALWQLLKNRRMDIQQLINQVRKGMPLAQKEMFMRFSPELYKVACRYCSDGHTANDIIQESWIKIFNNLSTYKEEGKFESWCKVIVIRTALSHRRKLKIHVDINEFGFDDYSLDPQVLMDMKLDDLMKVIDSIPRDYGDIFKLFVIEGYSHKEIAELLDISPSTSRCKVSLARKKLRSILSHNIKSMTI